MFALLLASMFWVGNIECKPIEDIATKWITQGAHHLRELPADAVTRFNSREPETHWSQVWLMDLPGGYGLVFGGDEDKVCQTGMLNPNHFEKAVKDLEGST